MNIDLTKYVVARWGGWFEDKDSFTANELRLGSLRDGVTLAGPLCIRVSVRARNHFALFGTSAVALQERDVFSYKLEIPPGQTWTYPAPRALGFDPASAASTGATTAVLASTHNAVVDAAADNERETLWGANAGFGIAIRPCGPELCADPCAPDPCRPADPCAPKKKDCGCQSGGDCGCPSRPDDVPCNFATGQGASTGTFFPAACEPCAPGAFVGMPPTKGPSLLVPAARGGTVRTRYFNGMFITKEDLWTDQNNNRLKHTLMNRAMGQGVVWGFDVAFDGETLCVLPGYGVDCCGNDLVVSSPYRVDAQLLLRDPAAAATLASAKAARMNLLLEYFECPEEPRPVHGDPCAPEAARCEMSRIRETVRLRLVPPIEVDGSGCIKDFLEEMKRLKGDPVTSTLITPPTTATAPSAAPVTATTPTTTAPFVYQLTSAAGSVTAPPIVASSNAFALPDSPEIKIAMLPDAGAAFTSIAVNQTTGPGSPHPNVVTGTGPGGVDWLALVPGTANGTNLTFEVIWKLKDGSGALYEGKTVINLLRQNDLPVVAISTRGEGTVTRTVPEPPPPPRISCLTEACDPEKRPRFPVPLPWLHEDPGHPGQAADPKLLVLGILYAVTMSRIQESGPATTPEVLAEQEKLANALNLAAWKLFYDNPPEDRRLSLVDALKRLFQCWCKSLLYTGPRCNAGCGPHGVVIGCALVEGGTLRMVDPWGGRRWVMHYPLLSHWGQQFGIAPPDALASKFFDLICCIAHGSSAPVGNPPQPGAPAGTSPIGAPASVIPLGAATLVFDQPTNVAGHLARAGVTPERTVTLNPIEFLSRVAEAVTPRAGAAPAASSSFVHYTVNGIPELNFVAPSATLAAASGSTIPRPPTPVAAAGASRLADFVRAGFAGRERAVPALLRSFAQTLTGGLLAALPIDVNTDVERALRDAMAAAEIRTLATLLDEDPDRLHVEVLGRTNASALADILATNEERASSVVTLIGDALRELGSEGRLASRDDLRKPAALKAFKKAITEGLHGLLSARLVGAEVDRALAEGG